MKQKGFNQYFFIIVLLLLGLVLINTWQKKSDDYTRANFIQDMEEGKVKRCSFIPTGRHLPAIWRS